MNQLQFFCLKDVGSHKSCIKFSGSCKRKVHHKLIEYTFFSLKIINPQNIDKNILEISDQNRINIEVTLLYFSTNQLKTQNKNILEISAQKLINKEYLGSKINK